MKKIFWFAVAAFILCCGAVQAQPTKEARRTIERVLGRFPKNVVLKSIPVDEAGNNRYATSARGGVLCIEGSSPVAICRGFYDYVSTNGYGVFNWSGSRFDLPARFPDAERREVASPFKHHLYYNVCTYGYTMPFWGWDEWQREIDWMAFHGFDMPLAPIAGEAIFARVWREMGLSDAEIDAYFTGPAHMPWMRMGNMSGLDGAPTAAWHKAQIALQHKIIDRMTALGMTPVYQGFAGFVPPAMKEHFPEIHLTQTKWATTMKNWMLSPMDDLFVEIGNRYIRAWEKEFGKGKYYLIDSFNEMDIPFGEKGSQERFDTLKRYGGTIYRSLSAANADAVWVMQGWMFGYARNLWDPESGRALLSGAPDGKMMIIDLAVDFNHYVWQSEMNWDYFSGFFGKDWIFSTVPNFGGRSALTGALDFYANGHLEALASPNKGLLTGYGTSPEGVENNDVVYEVIAAAGWSDRPIDLKAFLHNFSRSRYGAVPAGIETFWDEMLQSAYGTFTNNARYRWQLRPPVHRMPTMGVNDRYYAAIESFLDCAGELGGNELYRTDAVQYAAFYLAAKADLLLEAINWAYVNNRDAEAAALEERFERLLLDADRLLASHPILRLERWLDKAEKAGCTPAEKEKFVGEARRLITRWTDGPALADYSARVWSGLIRDFYVPRMKAYFGAMHGDRRFDFQSWEGEFSKQRSVSSVEPFADPLKEAVRLVDEAKSLTDRMVMSPAKAVGYWTPMDFQRAKFTYSLTIHSDDYEKAQAIRLTMPRGKDAVRISRIRFRSNHFDWAEMRPEATLDAEHRVLDVKIAKHDNPGITLSKEVTVYIYFEGAPAADSYGAIEVY